MAPVDAKFFTSIDFLHKPGRIGQLVKYLIQAGMANFPSLVLELAKGPWQRRRYGEIGSRGAVYLDIARG